MMARLRLPLPLHPRWLHRARCFIACGALLWGGSSAAAPAQTAADFVPVAPTPFRQSTDDALWTGPMLANSAATLPHGHFLVEPYLYDVSSPGSDGFGSLTYMLYGVTDRLTAGLVPVFGYTRVEGGPNGSGIGVGDVSLEKLVTRAVFLHHALEIGEITGVSEGINIRDRGRLVMLQNVANKVAPDEPTTACHQDAHRPAT